MLFILDLDGCVYRESQVVKGAVETLAYLQENGHTVTYATNNALLSRAQYRKKLRGMGFNVKLEEIMCAAYAAGEFLRKKKAKKVFVIGAKGLRDEIKKSGTRIVREKHSVKGVDFVAVGLDRQFSFKKLLAAQQFLLGGAKLMATNKDATYPGANNSVFPGCGSIVASVEAASGKEAFVVGKPGPFMLEKLLAQTGYAPKDTLVVGDRYETDILFGKKAGVKTALVLTGITSRKDLQKIPKRLHPDYVLQSVADLTRFA